MGCLKLTYYQNHHSLKKPQFFLRVSHIKKREQPKKCVNYSPYGKVLRAFGNQEKYLTTQHERDRETGLDYRGARYYDSDVARFLSVDPLAADYVSWSTYNYVMGNPVMFIDPSGMGSESCPTCPDDEKYDVFRNAKAEFVYNEDGSVSNVNNIKAGEDVSIENESGLTDNEESWIGSVPVLGPAIISGQYLKNEEYGQAVIWELYAFADLFTLGYASKAKLAGHSARSIAKNSSRSAAFQIAQSGGKHSGFLRNYIGRSPNEINRAINTLQHGKRGINVHMDKIQNPSKYVEGWNVLRSSHQESLIRGWSKEIQNAKEQIQILQDIINK